MLKSLTFLVSIFIWCQCTSQEIIGKWQFENIYSTENNKNLREIGSEDFLYILEDSTFNYNIESISLILHVYTLLDDLSSKGYITSYVKKDVKYHYAS